MLPAPHRLTRGADFGSVVRGALVRFERVDATLNETCDLRRWVLRQMRHLTHQSADRDFQLQVCPGVYRRFAQEIEIGQRVLQQRVVALERLDQPFLIRNGSLNSGDRPLCVGVDRRQGLRGAPHCQTAWKRDPGSARKRDPLRATA